MNAMKQAATIDPSKHVWPAPPGAAFTRNRPQYVCVGVRARPYIPYPLLLHTMQCNACCVYKRQAHTNKLNPGRAGHPLFGRAIYIYTAAIRFWIHGDFQVILYIFKFGFKLKSNFNLALDLLRNIGNVTFI
jgi:hypothetical protein